MRIAPEAPRLPKLHGEQRVDYQFAAVSTARVEHHISAITDKTLTAKDLALLEWCSRSLERYRLHPIISWAAYLVYVR